jgi:MFS family permease
MTNHAKTFLLLSYISIATFSAAIITPALPVIERSFHLGHGALEWIVSIFMIGYVLGQLLYGPLANHFGRVRSLQIGLSINIVGILLDILAVYIHNYHLLLAGRLITALGAASGLSCTFMLLNESLPPAEAKHAMSFSVISFSLGVGMAVTLGGIITQYLNWSVTFWVLLLHGVIMLATTRLLTETLTQPIRVNFGRMLKDLYHNISHKKLLVFSMAVGLMTVIAYGYSATAPLFAHHILHLSASQYGYFNLINLAGMLGAGFAGAKLIKNFGLKKTLSTAFAGLALTIISLWLLSSTGSTSIAWFFITTTALYLFGGLIFPAASYIASNATDDKAHASSATSFINVASGTVGVIVIGYLPLSDITSLATVITAFFALSILLILPYFMQKCSLAD